MKTSHVIVNTLPLLSFPRANFRHLSVRIETSSPFSRAYLHNLGEVTKERKKLIRKRTLTGKLSTKKGTLLASAIEEGSIRSVLLLGSSAFGILDWIRESVLTVPGIGQKESENTRSGCLRRGCRWIESRVLISRCGAWPISPQLGADWARTHSFSLTQKRVYLIKVSQAKLEANLLLFWSSCSRISFAWTCSFLLNVRLAANTFFRECHLIK